MIKIIKEKIKSLLDERKSIIYTAKVDNIPMTEYDQRRLGEITAKVNVLNEIVISKGVDTSKKQ